MSGLLYKDLICLGRAYKRNLTLVLVLYTVITFLAKVQFLVLMMPYLLGFYALSSLSFDDRCEWNRYALTLPVSRRQIVAGKYLLALLGVGAGLVYCLLMGIVLQLVGQASLSEILGGAVGVAVVSLLMNALLYPIAFKTSMEKARNAMLAGFAVFAAIVFGLSRLANVPLGLLTFLEENFVLLACLTVLLSLVLYGVSYFISCRIFARREF